MGPVSRPENLVIGGLMILLGLAWTLANLGRLDMLHVVRTWWPLTLVSWGALELYNTLASRRGR
jgi:hypothetical protein